MRKRRPAVAPAIEERGLHPVEHIDDAQRRHQDDVGGETAELERTVPVLEVWRRKRAGEAGSTSRPRCSPVARGSPTITLGAVVRSFAVDPDRRSSYSRTRRRTASATRLTLRYSSRSLPVISRHLSLETCERAPKTTTLNSCEDRQAFGDLPLAAFDDPRVTKVFLDWRDGMAKPSPSRLRLDCAHAHHFMGAG